VAEASTPAFGAARLILTYGVAGLGYSITATYLPLLVHTALAAVDPVLAFCGDGGFLMNGNEFITAVDRGLNLKVIVSNKGSYETIRTHQQRHFPNRVSGTDLSNPNFADLVRALGARANPGNLNSPTSVETAPEGEDLACDDWSKDEQKTPPHALSGVQGKGGAGRRSRRQDARRAGAAA
jgi:thiamine pyrophosphate-dependent acetolactate synthase large subunit-like protein